MFGTVPGDTHPLDLLASVSKPPPPMLLLLLLLLRRN